MHPGMVVTGVNRRGERGGASHRIGEMQRGLRDERRHRGARQPCPCAGERHGGVQLPPAPVAGAVEHGNAWMPVAHLVAAAITLAALLLADRVADTVGRAVRVLVRRLTLVPTPVVAPSLRVPAAGPRPRLVGALLHAALGSRGPPVGLVAV